MRFSLYYRGALKSNASPGDKHTIRRAFHTQLKTLWSRPPLLSFQKLLVQKAPDSLGVLIDANGFTFAPLVCEHLALAAELKVLLLWPQPPGAILSVGGDIDNRLKTLFDALRAPLEATALPAGTAPGSDETPFYCLLEDDRLITRVDVETDQLMEPGAPAQDVVVILRVETRQLRTMIGTLGLG